MKPPFTFGEVGSFCLVQGFLFLEKNFDYVQFGRGRVELGCDCQNYVAWLERGLRKKQIKFVYI